MPYLAPAIPWDERNHPLMPVFAFLIWFSAMRVIPESSLWVAWSARLSFLIAVACVLAKLQAGSRLSSLPAEFMAGLENCRMFMDMVMWPLTLFGLIFGRRRDWHSYVASYRDDEWFRIRREAWLASPETIHELADSSTKQLLADADHMAEYAKPVLRTATATVVATGVTVSASAQTPLKPASPAPAVTRSLQTDVRVIDPFGAPPTVFNRTTLTTKHFVAQAITTVTPLSLTWSNETGGGLKFTRTSGGVTTSVYADSYLMTSSAGVMKVTIGSQYFRTTPRLALAVPVLRLEKTLGGPMAVFLAANPFIKLGTQGLRAKLALAPDVAMRHTFGKLRAWSVGLGFDVYPRKGKGDRLEAAVLRNSAGQWQLRWRVIYNFAF